MPRTPPDDDDGDLTVDRLEEGDEGEEATESEDESDDLLAADGDTVEADDTKIGGIKRVRFHHETEVLLARKAKLKAALAAFPMAKNLVEPTTYEEPTFSQSFPLLEWARKDSHPNKTQRRIYTIAVIHANAVFRMADKDPASLAVHLPGKEDPSSDHDLQRSESGNIMYAVGQTLDRKKREHDSDDAEKTDIRHDGPVRRAKKSNPGAKFDPSVTVPFPLEKADAIFELCDVEAEAGPMLSRYAALFFRENATCEHVGEATGAKGKQASSRGALIGTGFLDAVLKIMARNEVEADGAAYKAIVETFDDSAPVCARRVKLAFKELDAVLKDAPKTDPANSNETLPWYAPDPKRPS